MSQLLQAFLVVAGKVLATFKYLVSSIYCIIW
jgi:hypothetical protein